MLDEFWTGLGGKLAERWLALLLSPALAFWAGGLAAWSWRHRDRFAHRGWRRTADGWRASLDHLPVLVQGALVVGLLILVALSALAVQRLSRPALRVLAGDWPSWLLLVTTPLRRLHRRRNDRRRERLRAYAAADVATLTVRERRRYQRLDLYYRRTPADPARQTLTRLGNALRAYEGRPLTRYGLDAAVCWPPLWLVLPEQTRTDVVEARMRLDSAARTCLWGVLFAGWTPWAWWAAPVGVLVAFAGYRTAFAASVAYGELFAAAFDVHRTLLYQSLRFPLPAGPATELRAGTELTHYLGHGSRSAPLRFSPASGNPSGS